MREEVGPFTAIAESALTEYGLEGASLTFIRHSDNVTFKVEAPDSGAFLLRLHVPLTRAMGAHGADVAAVASELAWLEALCRDTDLVLQKPIRNRQSNLVTPIAAEDRQVNCTLLHWMAGQPYQRDLESENTAFQIGEILARLHLHASQWDPPAGFQRPRRDSAYFEAMLRGLRPAVSDGQISPSDYEVLETSVALLIDMLSALPQDRQTVGIMHADGHKGNMLYDAGRIRLIDFSFCAVGNYMFDLGICFADMKEPLRRAFLGAYQSLRPLPGDYQRLVEGFFVGSMVGTFCYWVDNPKARDLLVRKVSQIAGDYAEKFNRGEFFWFQG